MGIFYNRQRKKARVKNWGWTADGGCGIINSGFDAPVVKLADTMDLGSIPATGRGSSPLGRTKKGKHAERVSLFWRPPFAYSKRRALRRGLIEYAGETARFRCGGALLNMRGKPPGFPRIHPLPRILSMEGQFLREWPAQTLIYLGRLKKERANGEDAEKQRQITKPPRRPKPAPA